MQHQQLASVSTIARLIKQQEQPLVASSRHRHQGAIRHQQANQLDEQPELLKLGARLLLRLASRTYLSVPLNRCLPLELDKEETSYSYDACSVEWNAAKLVASQQDSDELRKEFHLSELFSTNNIALTKPSAVAGNETTTFNIDYNFAKLSYLSVSSILASCGVFINVFIILIILFNSRQRQRNSILRNNNTEQNNLLLLQLTITGILLSSFVLIENFNIQNDNNPNRTSAFNPLETNTQAAATNNLIDDHHGQHPLAKLLGQQQHGHRLFQFGHNSAPLFSFLPPTPFHWGPKQRPPESGHQAKGPTLILKFLPQLEREDSDDNEVGFLEQEQPSYLVEFTDLNGRRTAADLSAKLHSLAAECLAEREPAPSDQPADSWTSRLLKVVLSPLLMNVVASVHIWTVAALAYDRYCAIAHPLRYLRSIHSSRARSFFLASWAISCLLNILWPISVTRSLQAEPATKLPNERCILGSSSLLKTNKLLSPWNEPQNLTGALASHLVELLWHEQQQQQQQQQQQFDPSQRDDTLLGELKAGQPHGSLLLVLSLLGFLVIILIPLLTISICNIRIYRIVKVHERRLSINSGSNVNPSCGIACQLVVSGSKPAAGSQMPYLAPRHRLVRQTSEPVASEKYPQTGGITASALVTNLMRFSFSSLVSVAKPHEQPAQKANDIKIKLEGEPQTSGSRKSSSVSQLLDSDLEAESQTASSSCSANNYLSNIVNCDHLWAKFGARGQELHHEAGIISQLKMAGLSFAGVAINEAHQPVARATQVRGRRLNKSSSCSLINLAHNHQQQQQVGRQSIQENPRKSYVSLSQQCSLISGRHQEQRVQTKLLIDNHDDHITSQSQKIPVVSLGTKSSAFNVIIWLIFTMLVFILPHFVLLLLDQQQQQAADNNTDSDYESTDQKILLFANNQDARPIEQLVARSSMILSKLIVMDQQNSSNQLGDNNLEDDYLFSKSTSHSWNLMQKSSIWLSCLCRILFLIMVPINGWLYGIRARSLRATLRMVLKQYINRRQANIEISQRQRSISSLRSKDSSFANLQSLASEPNHQSAKTDLAGRSSLKAGLKRVRSGSLVQAGLVPQLSLAGDMEPAEKLKRSTCWRANNSSIRFYIGDPKSDTQPEPLTDKLMVEQLVSSSGESSCAGSSKSLISASIQSSQSVSMSILVDNQGQGKTADSSTSGLVDQLCPLISDSKQTGGEVVSESSSTSELANEFRFYVTAANGEPVVEEPAGDYASSAAVTLNNSTETGSGWWHELRVAFGRLASARRWTETKQQHGHQLILQPAADKRGLLPRHDTNSTDATREQQQGAKQTAQCSRRHHHHHQRNRKHRHCRKQLNDSRIINHMNLMCERQSESQTKAGEGQGLPLSLRPPSFLRLKPSDPKGGNLDYPSLSPIKECSSVQSYGSSQSSLTLVSSKN